MMILASGHPSCEHAGIAVGDEVAPLSPRLEQLTLTSRTRMRAGWTRKMK